MTDPPRVAADLWRAAWAAPYHLAVVAGPDAGWVAPVDASAELLVGRSRDAGLRVADLEMARRHFLVRVERARVWAHPGEQARVWVGRAGRRGKRRWRRALGRTPLRVGDQLRAGSTTLELRRPPNRGPDVAEGPGAAGQALGWPRTLLLLLPVAVILGVTAVLMARGAPAYLALGALAAAGTAGASLAVRRGGNGAAAFGASGARTAEPQQEPPDPAALAVLVAGLGREAASLVQAPESRSEGVLVSPATDGRDAAAGAVARARWRYAQLAAGGAVVGPVLAWPGPGPPPPTPAAPDAANDTAVSATWLAAVTDCLGGKDRGDDLPHGLRAGDAEDIAEAWLAGSPGLDVTLGETDASVLDLARDGPHALVAGTTGSGKSELLQAWVLALASRHPPSEVSFLLVDYKGGATFAHAARLPHCVGLLTDLTPAESRRAVSALRHELRRRERILAEAGARDRESFVAGGGRLGRLVVVVDELRALLEEDESRAADLVAVATLGRSLGVHLVLATQRPGGVISGQLRANLTLRVCLRVLESGDAADVVGTTLPATFTEPGEAVISPGGRCRFGWLRGTSAADLTDAIQHAAERARRRRRADLLQVHRPWLPPLPEAPARGSHPAPVLLDRPEIPAHEGWRPPAGVLLVSGPARSGRSEALGALVSDLWGRGEYPGCHVVSRSGWGDPDLGTVASCSDLDVVARLLTSLAQGADPTALVAIDDAEHVVAALDRVLGPGLGHELLLSLLTSPRPGALLLASAHPHRWSGQAAHHLALGVRDAGAAVGLGIDRDLAEPRPLPGRGVLLTGGAQYAAQVVPTGCTTPAGRGADRAVLRLRPLPDHAVRRDLGARVPSGSRRVPLGAGLAGLVWVEVPERGALLVVGPPGSGRTGALRAIAASLGAAGVAFHDGAAPNPEPGSVLIVDDAEQLPEGRVAELLPLARGRCVLATTPSAYATDFRGLVGQSREGATVLALGGFAPAGARAPSGLPRPGRGVLVTPIGSEFVQVAL